jgi:16S rRNA (cytosine1402-N4)-methyltransferase
MNRPINQHIPVLREEALTALAITKDHWYIDATFGGGGHTQAILDQGGRVIGFDWDIEAISGAQTKFAPEIAAQQLILVNESFSKMYDETAKLMPDLVGTISGILFDFGTSTTQLMSSSRGFSFEGDGVLDMRMDQRLGVMAKDILAVVPEKQLIQLFFNEGGELDAKKIAKAIKSNPTPIETTAELVSVISRVKRRTGKLHPATKVFQALRIAVNSELSNIESTLPQAYRLLAPAGVIVTISFHEGEDRIAKHSFKQWADKGLGSVLTKDVITPSEAEIEKNPRSRSAKLRVFRKK